MLRHGSANPLNCLPHLHSCRMMRPNGVALPLYLLVPDSLFSLGDAEFICSQLNPAGVVEQIFFFINLLLFLYGRNAKAPIQSLVALVVENAKHALRTPASFAALLKPLFACLTRSRSSLRRSISGNSC